MEITTLPWIPRNPRNRWAWGLAWGNLALLLFWNFLPFYEYTPITVGNPGVWEAERLVMSEIWPSLFQGLYTMLGHSLEFEDILNLIASMALILMVAVQFLLVPMWRMFSASRVLRFIPAGICMLGFLAVICWFIYSPPPDDGSENFSIFLMLLIALNLLLSAVVLLLYHPEPVPDHTI